MNGTMLQDSVSDSQVPPHIWVKDGMSHCENDDQTESDGQSCHPLRQRTRPLNRFAQISPTKINIGATILA
jgi:hypothetical protein